MQINDASVDWIRKKYTSQSKGQIINNMDTLNQGGYKSIKSLEKLNSLLKKNERMSIFTCIHQNSNLI